MCLWFLELGSPACTRKKHWKIELQIISPTWTWTVSLQHISFDIRFAKLVHMYEVVGMYENVNKYKGNPHLKHIFPGNYGDDKHYLEMLVM